MIYDVSSEAQSDANEASYHEYKSKTKGDSHFRAAHQITGEADYIPGFDDGEPLKDYR